MAKTSLTWNTIWQDVKDEWGDSSDDQELLAIRTANKVLRSYRNSFDLESTIRLGQLFYISDFKKYPIPSDMKEGGIIDIRKTTGTVTIPLKMVSPYGFAQFTSGEVFTRFMNFGVEFFGILHRDGDAKKVIINTADETTGWAASSGASNITQDKATKEKGVASINFDISNATTPTITLTLTTAVDSSTLSEQKRLRFFMKFPTVANLTSVTVQYGSSSGNFWEQVLTTQASGEAFDTKDFNELELVRLDAEQTGTVDESSITHFQVKMTFSSATTSTDFRIDQVVLFDGEILEVEYYSLNTAKNANGNWQDGLTVSVDGADQEVPLMFDSSGEILTLDILAKLLGPEGNNRKKEIKLEAEAMRQTFKDNFPSRRKRFSRREKLSRLPSL